MAVQRLASVDLVMLAGQLRVGGWLSGATVTVRVVSLNRPPLSVTRRVKLALVAAQVATTSALTRPAGLTLMLLTVTPLTEAEAPPLILTIKVFSASSVSSIVAICTLLD